MTASTSDGDAASRTSRALRAVEIVVAILITCAAVWLHVVRMTKAGGLWRDEAGAVNLAQLSSLGEVAANLHHEAFPILFSVTVRAYSALTGGSDGALRVFGFVMGVSLLVVLWASARSLHRGVPLISLALLGLNASIIQWADWMRGHGLGTVLIVITLALVWRVATSPSAWVLSLAAVAAISSVQTLYYNAVLLLAIALAGAAVAARGGYWKRALVILSIGAVAAASLVPYLQTSRRAGESSFIYTVAEFPVSVFWAKLREALSGTAAGVEWIWVLLAVAALVAALVVQLRRAPALTPRARDAALYCFLTLIISVPAYFGFLRMLEYQTQPWYYIALMSVAAVAIDGALSVVARGQWVRAARIAVAISVAAWSFSPAWSAIQMRQTNVDFAAAKLNQLVAADDLVVVMPWYLGVPFGRYYTGVAEWMTVPPIADRKLQRYDLLKQQMADADPLAPLMTAMTNALRSGNRVWVIGQLMFPEGDQLPVALPPAPHPTDGWNEGTYQTSWNLRTMHFLQARVGSAEEVPIPLEQPVNPHENLRIVVVQGWRGSSTAGE